MMKAMLFGSIGTVIETSELQRQAYNQAFRDCGIGWEWSTDEYRALLRIPGGRNRLRAYAQRKARATPMNGMLDEVHRRKSELFRQALASSELELRSGVARLLAEARAADVRTGWVSTTERETIQTIASRFPDILDGFWVQTDRTTVAREKPHPDAYQAALSALDVSPAQAVAIEDTAESLASAVRAGVATAVTPGAFTMTHDFDRAAGVVSRLGTPEEPAEVISGPSPMNPPWVTLSWLDGLRSSGW